MGSEGLTQGIETKINKTRNYLSLREINESLAAENVALRNRIEHLDKRGEFSFFFL